MKKNLSNINRLIRLLVAVILTVLYFTGVISGTWGVVLLIVAVILLLTAITGFCPLLLLPCANGSCPFSKHNHEKKEL